VVAGGCFAPVDTDTAVLSALVWADDEPAADRGNVVVSYTNAGPRAAKWILVWRRAGSLVPNVLSTVTEPGGTGTMTLGTPITELSLGGFAPRSIGVVIGPNDADPVEVAYTGSLLEAGIDFHEGDIISFTLNEPVDGDYVIGLQITPGG